MDTPAAHRPSPDASGIQCPPSLSSHNGLNTLEVQATGWPPIDKAWLLSSDFASSLGEGVQQPAGWAACFLSTCYDVSQSKG